MALRLPGHKGNGATRTAVAMPGGAGSAELDQPSVELDQPQNELPQAQPPPAFGLSISKPCFSMVSV